MKPQQPGSNAPVLRDRLAGPRRFGLAKQIDAVGAADVERVAKKYLDPKSMVVIAIGDRARIAPELEKLDLGPVQQVP